MLHVLRRFYLVLSEITGTLGKDNIHVFYKKYYSRILQKHIKKHQY